MSVLTPRQIWWMWSSSSHLNLELFRKQDSPASRSIDIGDLLAQGASKGQTAIDPICQMEVEIATAKQFAQFDGKMYYFCCPGCKMKFEEDPVAYAGEAASTGSG